MEEDGLERQETETVRSVKRLVEVEVCTDWEMTTLLKQMGSIEEEMALALLKKASQS